MAIRKVTKDQRRHVRAWKKSGLTAREYGKQAGISHWSLYTWTTSLNQRQQSREPALRFAPVTVSEPPVETAPEPIDLVLSNGRRLRIGPGFEASMLKRLIVAVEHS